MLGLLYVDQAKNNLMTSCMPHYKKTSLLDMQYLTIIVGYLEIPGLNYFFIRFFLLEEGLDISDYCSIFQPMQFHVISAMLIGWIEMTHQPLMIVIMS